MKLSTAILLLILSLLTLMLYVSRGYGGDYRSWYREDYEWQIKHRTFWRGFSDPVPQGYTDHPVSTWNYRIIRQYERQRLRDEQRKGTREYPECRRNYRTRGKGRTGYNPSLRP